MKRFSLLPALTLTFALIATTGCNNTDSKSSDKSSKSNESIQSSQSVQTTQDQIPLSGKVIETMDGGNYTFMNIEHNGRTTWVATGRINVMIGQDISLKPGTTMTNFESKTLNRTFETIVFSGGPIDGFSGPLLENKPVDKSQVQSAITEPISVDKATGADAYTVSELYEKVASLENKRVVIRGKVVKFSPGIMGKNWIHIQDGSGDSSAGTHDIVVTSQETTSLGEVITINGILYKDKDFGSGYNFAVIVEEASILK
jgi:hypothetical protein